MNKFYKSQAWIKFRKIIIDQNTDIDGFVRCAECGKPIVNKYDLIVHHKTELTEANYQDAMIALNPDNVECVHFKCHNKLHDRWQGGNNGYRPRGKKVYVIYGAPCAGKSTWVDDNATENDLIVDMDNIWDMLTVCPKYIKPARLKGTAFEIRDKLYDIVKYRLGKWQDAYIITGGATKGDRERLATRVGADEFIYIDTDLNTCLERSQGKPPEWESFIKDWFSKYQE